MTLQNFTNIICFLTGIVRVVVRVVFFGVEGAVDVDGSCESVADPWGSSNVGSPV